MFNLAFMTENGRGTPKNPDQAASLYRRSADRGNPKAMFEVGRLYQNGIGLRKSGKDALIEATATTGSGKSKLRLATFQPTGNFRNFATTNW